MTVLTPIFHLLERLSGFTFQLIITRKDRLMIFFLNRRLSLYFLEIIISLKAEII